MEWIVVWLNVTQSSLFFVALGYFFLCRRPLRTLNHEHYCPIVCDHHRLPYADESSDHWDSGSLVPTREDNRSTGHRYRYHHQIRRAIVIGCGRVVLLRWNKGWHSRLLFGQLPSMVRVHIGNVVVMFRPHPRPLLVCGVSAKSVHCLQG
jgi:hypothetical protein